MLATETNVVGVGFVLDYASKEWLTVYCLMLACPVLPGFAGLAQFGLC